MLLESIHDFKKNTIFNITSAIVKEDAISPKEIGNNFLLEFINLFFIKLKIASSSNLFSSLTDSTLSTALVIISSNSL